MDLGIEVILELFSKEGLTSIFSTDNRQPTTENLKRIYSLRQDYINTILFKLENIQLGVLLY
jgi:hypothetical protein